MRALVPLLALIAACARSDERWIEALADPDPFERALAAFALCEQAPEHLPLALDVLLETIDRSELHLESVAIRQLHAAASTAPAALRAHLESEPFMTDARRRALESALGALEGDGR